MSKFEICVDEIRRITRRTMPQNYSPAASSGQFVTTFSISVYNSYKSHAAHTSDQHVHLDKPSFRWYCDRIRGSGDWADVANKEVAIALHN